MLDLHGLGLSDLPALPSGTRYLNCAGNRLRRLPDPLPPDLEILDARDNLLAYLPPLPPRLEKLWVSGNRLVALPLLPETLCEVDVARNRLRALPLSVPAALCFVATDHNPYLDATSRQRWHRTAWRQRRYGSVTGSVISRSQVGKKVSS